MEKKLKVLILEDNRDDAEIIQHIILKAGMPCLFFLSMDKKSFLEAIDSFSPDVILSDNSLPQFDSEEALTITRQKFPHTPFILVTGTVSEEYAVKITKSGADDYILKDRLARLPAAIEAALNFRKAEMQLEKTFAEKEMLASRMLAILNTIPANIALLDSDGCILDANDAWKSFAAEIGFIGPRHGIGLNYFSFTNPPDGNEITDSNEMSEGIRAVLNNERKEFICEHTFHFPSGTKWFRTIVTPLLEKIYSGAVVMHTDITGLKKLELERLENKMTEQKKITKAILHAQEKERNLIGRELHDNVNQILAGTKLILSTAQLKPGNKGAVISNAISNLQHAIDENRKIAHELVAPDFKEIKITDQLNILAEGMLKKAGIDIAIETTGFKEDLLSDEQKLAIYRVAQEQCTNILKHAEAKLVSIALAVSAGQFQMKMADNGKGMENTRLNRGIGFRNIRSRLDLINGSVQIDTAPGKGFVMTISIPLNIHKPV